MTNQNNQTETSHRQETKNLRVAIACDHRGFEGKKKLLPTLHKLVNKVQDFGCESTTACDYPDFAAPAAKAVGAGEFDIGILLDGTGIGMSIVANKCENVRAALAHDEVTARRAREHNHCNVLCLGTDLLADEHIRTIVEIFLSTPYTPGRHDRRIDKIRQLELEIAKSLLSGQSDDGDDRTPGPSDGR